MSARLLTCYELAEALGCPWWVIEAAVKAGLPISGGKISEEVAREWCAANDFQLSGISSTPGKVMVECSAELAKRFDELEDRLAFRPAWIAGYVSLGRYIGRSDKKGRVARAWAKAEGLKVKLINGTPHFSIRDVDAAMRNGRVVEVAV